MSIDDLSVQKEQAAYQAMQEASISNRAARDELSRATHAYTATPNAETRRVLEQASDEFNLREGALNRAEDNYEDAKQATNDMKLSLRFK